ncbi:MAG: hypothetical protein AAFQ88_05805 [Pseudomonadota bacterium]
MTFHKVEDTAILGQLGSDGASMAVLLPVLIAIMLGAGRELTVLSAIFAGFALTMLA